MSSYDTTASDQTDQRCAVWRSSSRVDASAARSASSSIVHPLQLGPAGAETANTCRLATPRSISHFQAAASRYQVRPPNTSAGPTAATSCAVASVRSAERRCSARRRAGRITWWYVPEPWMIQRLDVLQASSGRHPRLAGDSSIPICPASTDMSQRSLTSEVSALRERGRLLRAIGASLAVALPSLETIFDLSRCRYASRAG